MCTLKPAGEQSFGERAGAREERRPLGDELSDERRLTTVGHEVDAVDMDRRHSVERSNSHADGRKRLDDGQSDLNELPLSLLPLLDQLHGPRLISGAHPVELARKLTCPLSCCAVKPFILVDETACLNQSTSAVLTVLAPVGMEMLLLLSRSARFTRHVMETVPSL